MRHGPPRVAVFGIGLAAYWPQFDGLRDRLAGYQAGIERRLEKMGAEIVSAGLVDTPQAARAAGAALAAAQPQLLFVYTATYATSSQVLPVVQAVDAPVVVLNLQPTRTVDYETMILLADGVAWFKSEAAIRIAQGLGLPWSLAALLRLVPRVLRDAVYVWVARNRIRWFASQQALDMVRRKLM